MPQEKTSKPLDDQQAPKADEQELDEQDLDKVSGGALRRGGDDDLDELEVER